MLRLPLRSETNGSMPYLAPEHLYVQKIYLVSFVGDYAI